MTRSFKLPNQGRQIGDQQGGMGLSGRAKSLFDTEVDPQSTSLKPAPASLRQMDRLLHLGNVERSCVEVPRYPLLPGRHCELDVMQPFDPHEASIQATETVDVAGWRFRVR